MKPQNVAAARVAVKRKLRRRGVAVNPNATTAELAATLRASLPAFAAAVCPNCGQWQHKATGDCLNECAARGFAPFAARNE
jgi:hypothetical protein